MAKEYIMKPLGYSVAHNSTGTPQTELFKTYKQALLRFQHLRRYGVNAAYLIERYPMGFERTIAETSNITYCDPFYSS